jgi:ankyrin repeat protein
MSKITLESQLIEIIKDEDMAENIKCAKIDMLIKLGVKNEAKNEALLVACRGESEKIVEMLILNGADIGVKNSNNRSVVAIAKDENMRKVIFEAAKKKQKNEDDKKLEEARKVEELILSRGFF